MQSLPALPWEECAGKKTMTKKLTVYVKNLSVSILLFALFWFVNSGFLTETLWLLVQAGLFTVVTLLIFKYQKIKLAHWFLVIVFLYVSSAVFEIFELPQISIMAASSGFGILTIVILFQVLKNFVNNHWT